MRHNQPACTSMASWWGSGCRPQNQSGGTSQSLVSPSHWKPSGRHMVSDFSSDLVVSSYLEAYTPVNHNYKHYCYVCPILDMSIDSLLVCERKEPSMYHTIKRRCPQSSLSYTKELFKEIQTGWGKLSFVLQWWKKTNRSFFFFLKHRSVISSRDLKKKQKGFGIFVPTWVRFGTIKV